MAEKILAAALAVMLQTTTIICAEIEPFQAPLPFLDLNSHYFNLSEALSPENANESEGLCVRGCSSGSLENNPFTLLRLPSIWLSLILLLDYTGLDTPLYLFVREIVAIYDNPETIPEYIICIDEKILKLCLDLDFDSRIDNIEGRIAMDNTYGQALTKHSL